MHFERMKIKGFSSFEETDWINLSSATNVVMGGNNSGKSSFLRALTKNPPYNPHKNPSAFLPGNRLEQNILSDIRVSGSEIRERLARFDIKIQTSLPNANEAEILDSLKWFDDPKGVLLRCQASGGNLISSRELTFRDQLGARSSIVAQIGVSEGRFTVQNMGGGESDNIITAFAHHESNSFFYFPAQRMNLSKTPFGRHERLVEDASNLAGVLAFLSGNNQYLFNEIIERVRQVIPSVQSISVSPKDHEFEILIWPDRRASNGELAFSLDRCGTGVSQVIAIFTAIVTSSHSVIVIDEINSYLHPHAAKTLVSIISNEYHGNQYILSSHSSEVISHPSIQNIIMLEFSNFRSHVNICDRGDLIALRGGLRALGVSMTDVLGADGIVWVEGPTEEIVFPALCRRFGVDFPDGMRFSSVSSTGDFSRRGSSKKQVVEVYESVSRVVAPISIGQSFLLDREQLSDDAVKSIEASTDSRMKLIPYRCIENYVIDPEAIAKILVQEGEDEEVCSVSAISQLIDKYSLDVSFGGVSYFSGDYRNEEWLKRVDGVGILQRLFLDVTENRVEFRKTYHTPLLFQLVDDAVLKPLSRLLAERIKAALKQ